MTKLLVTFLEHVPQDRVVGMTSGIAAYGNVQPGSADLAFVVEVFRLSKLPRLKARLAEWERLGYLRWTEDISD